MPPSSAIAPGPGLPDPDFVVDVRTCWCMGGLRRCGPRESGHACPCLAIVRLAASSDAARGRHPPRAGPPTSPLRYLAEPVSAGSDGLTPVSRFHTRADDRLVGGARWAGLGGDPRESTLVGGSVLVGDLRLSDRVHSCWVHGFRGLLGTCPGLLPGPGDHVMDADDPPPSGGCLIAADAATSKFSPLR